MSRSDADTVQVLLVTAPDSEVGAEIGRDVVGRRLAACVNLVGPIRSIYRWREKVEEDSEVLLVIKTRAACVDALSARVREVHPYDVPELLVLPSEGGSADYLRWVIEETGS